MADFSRHCIVDAMIIVASNIVAFAPVSLLAVVIVMVVAVAVCCCYYSPE